jgi:hypothetical protein
MFKPKRGDKRNVKEVIPYQQERKAEAMFKAASVHMPSFLETVRDNKDLAAYFGKAAKYGLPRLLYFSKGGTASPLVKALSLEYRRKILIAQVKGSKSKAIAKEYGVRRRPAFVVLDVEGRGAKEAFGKAVSFNKLNNWIYGHALKRKVGGKAKKTATKAAAGKRGSRRKEL